MASESFELRILAQTTKGDPWNREESESRRLHPFLVLEMPGHATGHLATGLGGQAAANQS